MLPFTKGCFVTFYKRYNKKVFHENKKKRCRDSGIRFCYLLQKVFLKSNEEKEGKKKKIEMKWEWK